MDSCVTSFTLCDFLGECASDLQAGRLRPLRHYLERYPGHVEEIAREFLALVDGGGTGIAALPRIGRYELLGELARGGQGRVHMARDPALGRFAAIKILELAGTTDGARRARFRREVAVAAQIDHPFLCRLFEADVDHAPPYAAMEFVPGRTLADAIAAPPGDTSRGPVAPRNAQERAVYLRFFVKVARAMQAMHDAGIVHRDLKPANLMVTPDGDPRVLDFGLASPADAIGTLTMTEALLGTLPYMAPEQLQGGHIDTRADVFALGVTMFECCTRERPFAGNSPAARTQAIAEGVPWARLRALPADLRAVLTRALAASPGDRYASGADLSDDLQRMLEHRPVLARPIGPLRAAQRWSRRHPWLTAWLVTMAVGLGIATTQSTAAEASLATTRQLERGVFSAVQTLDPWTRKRGSGSLAAFGAMQRANADSQGGSLLVARLRLRDGDPAGALRELQERTDDGAELLAARLASMVMLRRMDEARALLGARPEASPAIVDAVAEIAGELYRSANWTLLDELLGGALELLEEPAWADHRVRWPLCAWELQAACVRRNYADCLALWLRETGRVRTRGDGPSAAIEIREAFLRLAADLNMDTVPREMLRGFGRATHTAATDGDELRALRIEALVLATANATDDASLERMQDVVDQLVSRPDASEKDVVEARWRFARLVRETQPARCRQMLHDAWVVAGAWAAATLGHEQAILQALVQRDHGVFNAATLGDEASIRLRSQAARALIARLGPGDPRVLATLFEPPLDALTVPEATDWFRQAIDQVGFDPRRQQVRAECLLGLLRAALGRQDSVQIEAYALELQQSTTGSLLALMGGHAALVSSHSAHARATLANDWLAWHGNLAGADLAVAMVAQAEDWGRRPGSQGLGDRWPAVMLAALGTTCLERDWIVDAGAALEQAAVMTARSLGVNADGWLEAALSLPPWERASADLLSALAQLSERRGDLDGAERLLHHIIHPPSSLAFALGLKRPSGLDMSAYARVLLAKRDYAGAEAELLRRLQRAFDSREPEASVAAIRAELMVVYELTLQWEKVAQQRALVRR